MKSIIIVGLLFVSSLFSSEDLTTCVQSDVSRTSVIFTCMHGEYYIEYTSSSKREVKNLKVLYTKADKFKYLNKKNK